MVSVDRLLTPAVGTLLQIHARLEGDRAQWRCGEREPAHENACRRFQKQDQGRHSPSFPNRCQMPLLLLHPQNASAYDIFLEAERQNMASGYVLMVATWQKKIFRVGHLGNLSPKDNTTR